MELFYLLALFAYLMMQLFQLGLMTIALKFDDFDIGIQCFNINLQLTGRQFSRARVAIYPCEFAIGDSGFPVVWLLPGALRACSLYFELSVRYASHSACQELLCCWVSCCSCKISSCLSWAITKAFFRFQQSLFYFFQAAVNQSQAGLMTGRPGADVRLISSNGFFMSSLHDA